MSRISSVYGAFPLCAVARGDFFSGSGSAVEAQALAVRDWKCRKTWGATLDGPDARATALP